MSLKRNQIKTLDQIWSEKVKELANNRCQVTGKDRKITRLNSCHIISRRYRATRWGSWIKDKKGKLYYDLNGFCATFDKHMQYDQHGPEEKFIRERIIGLDRYEQLRQVAVQTIAKNQDFDEIKSILQSLCKK